MQELNPISNNISGLKGRAQSLRGIFNFEEKQEKLTKVLRELKDPEIWYDQEKALGRRRASLETVVLTLKELFSSLEGAGELLEMAAEEGDEAAALCFATTSSAGYAQRSAFIGW